MNKSNEINDELYTKIQIEKEDTGDLIMDKPFNPNLIKIDLKSPNIYLLMDRIKQNPPEIDLFTEFQRKGNLWDIKKQSRLIESILIKIPLPAFFFDGTEDNKWLVVDGLQRLSSLKNFIIEKSLKLEGLEFLKNLNGKYYDELPRHMKRDIDTTQITAHIINPGTPPEVKFNIFKRINTGGLVLQPQEIRHALNQGVAAEFIAELAELEIFKMATEYSINSSRMLDREFVTRFIAFSINELENYSPDLDSFLNNTMIKLKNYPEAKLRKLKASFIHSMDLAHKIFDNWAFRKADNYPDRRKPINKALFETWAVTLSKVNEKDGHKLINKCDQVKNLFSQLCSEDEEFWDSISSGTGDKMKVQTRFNKINLLVREFLND